MWVGGPCLRLKGMPGRLRSTGRLLLLRGVGLQGVAGHPLLHAWATLGMRAFNQWYGTQSRAAHCCVHPHKCLVTRQAVCCRQAVLLTGLLARHLLAPTAATSSHTHQLFVVLACTGGSTVAGLGAAFRWLCKTVLCIAARVWCMCGPAAGTSSLCLSALLDRCASCFRTDACC